MLLQILETYSEDQVNHLEEHLADINLEPSELELQTHGSLRFSTLAEKCHRKTNKPSLIGQRNLTSACPREQHVERSLLIEVTKLATP